MSEQKDTQKDTQKETIEKETIDTVVYHDQRSVALRTPQSIYFVKEHDKVAMLALLLNDYKETQIVIVVKSKKKADALSAFLISKSFNATAVHGNHRQTQQQEAASKFNQATVNIIITTDMILKTLALENIKLILSFDLPDNVQDYYNRLAFMKELGIAMALISPEDEQSLVDIEYNMKSEIEEKYVEGFEATAIPKHKKKTKDRSKKPRHKYSKDKQEKDS